MSNGFVTLANLVSEVLLGIGDENHKRYEIRATQWILNTIRRVHVNVSPYYKEERMMFSNEDISTIDYPNDSVKILSVGIYRNDEFWPFTKKQNMSTLTSGGDGSEFDQDANEGLPVPQRGMVYGERGSNIGYWMDDQQHCRIMVRLFSRYASSTGYLDVTSHLNDKGVVVRYKSTGVDCSSNICVPIEMKDMVVNKVIYEFMRRGWGVTGNNYNVELQRQEVDTLQSEYEALVYEPSNFWEVKDAIYGSLNTTARR